MVSSAVRQELTSEPTQLKVKSEEALSPLCIRRVKVSSSDLKFHLRPVKKNQIPFNTDCGDSVDTSSAPREARASIHSVVSSALRQQLTQVRLGPTQTFRLRGSGRPAPAIVHGRDGLTRPGWWLSQINDWINDWLSHRLEINDWRFVRLKSEEALLTVCIRRGKVSSSD